MGRTFKDNRNHKFNSNSERNSDRRFNRGIEKAIWTSIFKDWKKEREEKENYESNSNG